jgi:hypothetical protein
LQIAVTRYIEYNLHEPYLHRCSGCTGQLAVQSLTIPDMAWLWFELRDPVSPISPSLCLVFDARGQRRVYTLQAVIYTGGCHFTARLFDRSDVWWNYNDMRRYGEPRAEHILDERELLRNGDRRAAYLLYGQVDHSD